MIVMILHYIKISVRNILKYKTQTVINVCSIAVSMMLLSVIASMLLTIKPLSILRQPYSDRIVKLRSSDPNSLVLGEDRSVTTCRTAIEVRFCNTLF